MSKQTTTQSVLIIDDSVLQRQHAAAKCREAGVGRILEAGSGEQALRLLQSMSSDELPEAIIVDLEMPGMDGVQVIQKLKEQGFMIPLLIASARDLSLIQTVESMAGAWGMPVLGGIRKPIDSQILQRRLACRGSVLNMGLVRVAAAGRIPFKNSVDAQSLRNALRDGHIFMHYQPKVGIQSGVVHGVEALARWVDPEKGIVPPDIFVPLAEQSGLVRELTMSVVKLCFQQMSSWCRELGQFNLRMAINLSPLLLDDLSLVEEIDGLLISHGIQARQIIFEVTEGALAHNLSQAMAMLARLRLKGFGLSIDDYGTGFSSMQQLSQFPFTELKIDRSFVRGAHERPNLRVILESAIQMARRLELMTVAEGIETIEDWESLRELGCKVGQGYLIARPMAGNQVLDWIIAWNAGGADQFTYKPNVA